MVPGNILVRRLFIVLAIFVVVVIVGSIIYTILAPPPSLARLGSYEGEVGAWFINYPTDWSLRANDFTEATLFNRAVPGTDDTESPAFIDLRLVLRQAAERAPGGGERSLDAFARQQAEAFGMTDLGDNESFITNSRRATGIRGDDTSTVFDREAYLIVISVPDSDYVAVLHAVAPAELIDRHVTDARAIAGTINIRQNARFDPTQVAATLEAADAD